MEDDQELDLWISAQGELKVEIGLVGHSPPPESDAELWGSYDWKKHHRQMFVLSVELVLKIAARVLMDETVVSLRVIAPRRRQQ